MKWAASIASNIAGKLGELKTPKETGSPAFRRRQAIREHNALLSRTDPTRPAGTASISCLKSEKLKRRNQRHDLIRSAQSKAAGEMDEAKKRQLAETADRLAQDMDRVEDARLALHTYTANEDPDKQEDFLRDLRDKPPPGFKMASLDQVAEDFGVDRKELEKLVVNNKNPSQKIHIYVRDEEILGPGPKYAVAFRGSTIDRRDWNNNGRNEASFEAPHQKNAARLGAFLRNGALGLGQEVDSLVSVTGHSKGGSEAQAFAAAARCIAKVFNPAGFKPEQYVETEGVSKEEMRVDRTTVVRRGNDGDLLKSTKTEVGTDPLYMAQHQGASRLVMQKPVTTGQARELAPIDPNMAVPCGEHSDTEAHSMLQVIEALERDKESDQKVLKSYLR